MQLEKRHLFLKLLTVLLGFTTAGLASAANLSCTVAINPMNFGIYTPTRSAIASNTDVSTTASIDCSCTGKGSQTMTYSMVASSASGVANGALAMSAAGAVTRLSYGLYSDAARANDFPRTGSAVSGSSSVSCKGQSSTAAIVTIYGRVPDSASNRNVIPSIYSDTVSVTVTYN